MPPASDRAERPAARASASRNVPRQDRPESRGCPPPHGRGPRALVGNAFDVSWPRYLVVILWRMMLSAPPARNHSICSSFIVWLASKSTVVPSGLTICAATGASGRQVGQAEERQLVVLADLVVDRRVGEREREHALLLQVRLVDAGEAADEDDLAVPEARLHGGVLARRALAVVLVADGHPADTPARAGAWRCRGTSGSDRRADPCRCRRHR